jgi:uncharacterized protein with FMN-binding domain
MDTKNKIITVVGSIALIATAGAGGFWLFATPDSPSTTTTIVSQSSSPAASAPNTSQATPAQPTPAAFKDGTYSATVRYAVPRGDKNGLTAEVTIMNGRITAVKTSNDYLDQESRFYIEDFNANVESDAKGQTIADYSPSRIGGASLTTYAFDSVLDTIRTNAKV